jgi:elongation factor G
MKPVTHVMSVALVPSDAIAALQLREAVDAMCASDTTLGVEIGPVNEIVLQGVSELHLKLVVDRLNRDEGLAFEVGQPQVHYREAITKTIEWDHIHKRQTSGSGEYARVTIRFEPGVSGSGFQFENKAAEAVPPAFVPAVERGLAGEQKRGPIAGFPVMDLACALIGGDYHDTDSTAQTFEIAARACLREALPKAGPRLLEPMMLVVVLTPEDHMGDVVGDLNQRRGQVQGMETHDTMRAITAIVPLANLFGYEPTLITMTRGQASYTMAFDHYEQVPPPPPGGDDNFPMAGALRA